MGSKTLNLSTIYAKINDFIKIDENNSNVVLKNGETRPIGNDENHIAAGNHTHGTINNDGTISTFTNVINTDLQPIICDTGDDNKIKKTTALESGNIIDNSSSFQSLTNLPNTKQNTINQAIDDTLTTLTQEGYTLKNSHTHDLSEIKITTVNNNIDYNEYIGDANIGLYFIKYAQQINSNQLNKPCNYGGLLIINTLSTGYSQTFYTSSGVVSNEIWYRQYLTSNNNWTSWIRIDGQDKENISNKITTSLSENSTDDEYPSAKLVYSYINSIIGDIDTWLVK